MNKRQFIDAVRQYAQNAQRKNTSYAVPVQQLSQLYVKSCEESGMERAELDKEMSWSEQFIAREYASYDRINPLASDG